MLEDDGEDVLGLVVQAMRIFPVNEEVQLHGCGALQLLLETGEGGRVLEDPAQQGREDEEPKTS